MKRLIAVTLALASLAGCKKKDNTASAAKEMLLEFVKPGADQAALWAALHPKPEDYDAVFVGDAVDRAKGTMEPMWADANHKLAPSAEQTQVDVAGATPDQLAKHEGTAVGCPAAYKNIADKLNAKIIVYCFRFSKPGEHGGTAGDALVNVNGHWAYFPKPFRYLNPAMPVPSATPSAGPAASGAPSADPSAAP